MDSLRLTVTKLMVCGHKALYKASIQQSGTADRERSHKTPTDGHRLGLGLTNDFDFIHHGPIQ